MFYRTSSRTDDLGQYYLLIFLVTLGKVNRDCAFSDAILKANNKVVKNGCNSPTPSSKECYCDTNLCNTNIQQAQQGIEFIEVAGSPKIPNSGALSYYLNENFNLFLSLTMSLLYTYS